MAGMDDAELRRQCVDVREHLADVTGQQPRSFAYPFGHFDARARMAVQAAGYELAFSVHDDAGRYAISRVDINASDDALHFRVKLLPAYRPLWRAAGRVSPVRSAVRRALALRRKLLAKPAHVPPRGR
jgi:peptidoglycan/xylan/chitin deacetylase (PgdA/CDA1 family)